MARSAIRLFVGSGFSRDAVPRHGWNGSVPAANGIEPEGSSYKSCDEGRGFRWCVARCRFVVGSGFSRDAVPRHGWNGSVPAANGIEPEGSSYRICNSSENAHLRPNATTPLTVIPAQSCLRRNDGKSTRQPLGSPSPPGRGVGVRVRPAQQSQTSRQARTLTRPYGPPSPNRRGEI
jgi:hypothetical protein